MSIKSVFEKTELAVRVAVYSLYFSLAANLFQVIAIMIEKLPCQIKFRQMKIRIAYKIIFFPFVFQSFKQLYKHFFIRSDQTEDVTIFCLFKLIISNRCNHLIYHSILNIFFFLFSAKIYGKKHYLTCHREAAKK